MSISIRYNGITIKAYSEQQNGQRDQLSCHVDVANGSVQHTAGSGSLPLSDRHCVCSMLVQICVRSMAKCDAVTPLIAAMKRRGDIIHITAEAIKKMYDLNIPELVVQVSGRCLLPLCGNSLPPSFLLSLLLFLLLSSSFPFLSLSLSSLRPFRLISLNPPSLPLLFSLPFPLPLLPSIPSA